MSALLLRLLSLFTNTYNKDVLKEMHGTPTCQFVRKVLQIHL